MASMSEVDEGRRIYFKAANGSRQILYVSRMNKKKAEGVLRCINDLERCAVDGSIPSPSTTMWLADISADFHGKLSKHGLCQPRKAVEPPAAAVTLGGLIENFQRRPKWAKIAEGTRVNHRNSFRHILEYFGADRDAATISETEAEDMVETIEQRLAEATAARIAGAASMIMRYGVRSRLLQINPFEGTKRGSFVTPHKAYVKAETCLEVIDACPDLETKLVVALARFAGLRTPSEPRVLRWVDVDWSGRKFYCDSPKTGPRYVPIVAELMPLLEQQFEAVPEGTEFVLPEVATAERSTYPHRITRVVERLNMERWPRLMHSMRASRQTDWNEVFPAHVTAAWMGNSPEVGDKHYNRMLDAHFEAATNPTHNPTQTVTAIHRHDASASRAGD